MRIKSKFYRFLKEHKCFAQYIIAFHSGSYHRKVWAERFNGHFHELGRFESVNEFVENIKDKSEIIQFSFIWERTINGSEYWLKINELWRNEISKL